MTLLSAGKALVAGQALCNLSDRNFWVSYIAFGGTRPPDELLAYMEGNAEWSATEHDAAAHALNDHCQELGLGLPVPYADEF